jgi:D-psicose/D-tagatose/L-ribulose 3-epimerase
MDLSVSNIAWPVHLEDAAFAILLKNEISSLEVAPTKYWSELPHVPLEKVLNKRQEVQSRGITIIAAQSLLFGKPELKIFGNDIHVDSTIDYLKHVIDICAALGCKDLVFGSPKNRIKGPRTFDEACKESANFFSKVAEFSGSRGINFCLEPNAIQYGCDFVTNVSEAVKVIEFVNHPNFGLNLDLGNMLMSGENVEQTLARTLEYAMHIHISAPNLAPVYALANGLSLKVWQLLKKFPRCLSIEMLIPTTTDPMQELDRCLQFVCQNLETC